MAIDLGPDGLTLGSTTINDWDDVGGGKVLQVVQTHTGSSYSSNNTNFVTVTGLTTSFTPVSSTSTVYVTVDLNLNYATNDYIRGGVRILRDGSPIADDYEVVVIGIGTPLSLTTKAIYTAKADSLGTSAESYTVQFRRENYAGSYGGAVVVNDRSDSDSRITLMEVEN